MPEANNYLGMERTVVHLFGSWPVSWQLGL